MGSKKQVDKYVFRVEWSEEDRLHIGRCIEFPSLSAHGKTPESALKEIRSVTEKSIKWMIENKESIPEPLCTKVFKGNLTLRIPPAVHRKLAIKSAEEGVSINQYILSKIAS